MEYENNHPNKVRVLVRRRISDGGDATTYNLLPGQGKFIAPTPGYEVVDLQQRDPDGEETQRLNKMRDTKEKRDRGEDPQP